VGDLARERRLSVRGGGKATDGIFNIDKGLGITSHNVVARVRRLLKQKRVGHAGTLDPLASGVLPILVGQATRLAEYLSESGKAYRALIRFGAETTTYDGEGEVTREAPVALTRDEIQAALPEFLGEQDQRPPIYSAIKRGGRPLYALARAGEAVTAEPRRVRIDALELLAWDSPDLLLAVECGKGTYIRSIAHDLGARLGPGAFLAALVRWRSGPFRLEESISLDRLEAALADGSWRRHLYAADVAVLDRRAAILGPAREAALRNGQVLRFDSTETSHQEATGAPDELLRAYSIGGHFLGLLRWNAEAAGWQPHKVLQEPPAEEATGEG
jgi:tRNA pseudouridine55 synthase